MLPESSRAPHLAQRARIGRLDALLLRRLIAKGIDLTARLFAAT
jgi:hypothetical protein